MQNKLTEIVQSLTNEELNEAFLNIKELQEKGELGPDNVFRRTKARIEEELNITYSMHAMEREILYLIAQRAYPLPATDKRTCGEAMNASDKELFIARVKGLMDDGSLIHDMRQSKSLLIHYAQKEDWDKVTRLAEELSILREERILRLESR